MATAGTLEAGLEGPGLGLNCVDVSKWEHQAVDTADL